MNREIFKESSNNVLKVRKGKVRSWSELSSYLPEDVNPHDVKFIRTYFRGQLRIAEGRKKKAREIFIGLDRKVGFKDFEEANSPLLAAIDIVVRGSTNRRLFEKPSFRVSNDN